MLYQLWLLYHLWLLHEPGWIHGVLNERDTISGTIIRLHERLIESAPHGDMVRQICIETTVPITRTGSQMLSESSVNSRIFFVLLRIHFLIDNILLCHSECSASPFLMYF